FNALTRRVAEFSGVDASEIEADAKLLGEGARTYTWRRSESSPSPALAGEGASEATREGARATTSPGPGTRGPPPPPPRHGGGGKEASARGKKTNGAAQTELTPRSLAEVRAAAAHKSKVDRARYEVVRTLPRLQEWIARAVDLGVVAVDTQTTSIDPMQAGL